MPTKKKTIKQTKQKMVSFDEAIVSFWKKYFVFSGTAQRSEFWWWTLFNIFVSLTIAVAFMFSPFMKDFFDAIWFVATLIPWLALYSRRFHDAGYSSKWLFIPMAILTFVFPILFVLASLSDTEILSGLLGVFVLALVGFAVFWFVVLLTPSKLKNNPYRK